MVKGKKCDHREHCEEKGKENRGSKRVRVQKSSGEEVKRG